MLATEIKDCADRSGNIGSSIGDVIRPSPLNMHLEAIRLLLNYEISPSGGYF